MRVPVSTPLSLRQALCLVLLSPWVALAQVPAHPGDAADPDGAVAPLAHSALEALPFDSEAPSPHVWHQAHEAVAEFPRGHADIVAWEQRAAAQPGATSAAKAPHSGHGPRHHHMGDAAGSSPAQHPAMHPHHHTHGSKP